MADTTSLSSSQVVADPDCDLVLLVGPDEVAIEVCSKVLALASPVFAAMFGPHFAEGKALRTPSAYEAPSVSLPEDDAEAMIKLCYALHLKLNMNDKNITFELCFTLAKLCDKYNASLALGSWSELWMKPWIDTLKGDERCFKAIYIARAFGNQHAFWSITRDVMLYYNADFVDLPDPGLAKELLPDRLLASINGRREEGVLDLQTAIEDIIAPYVSAKCISRNNHRVGLQMCGLLTIIGYIFQELSRLDLWPLSKTPRKSNIPYIMKQVSNFETYKPNDSEDVEYHNQHSQCMRHVGVVNFRSVLKKAAYRAQTDQKGLCLSCINKGKITKEDGNCGAYEEWNCETLAERNG